MLFVVLEFIKICRLFIGIILMLIQVHRHRKGFFWERGEEAYKVSYLGQWLPSRLCLKEAAISNAVPFNYERPSMSGE